MISLIVFPPVVISVMVSYTSCDSCDDYLTQGLIHNLKLVEGIHMGYKVSSNPAMLIHFKRHIVMEIVGLQRCIVKVPTKTIYWKHSSYEITKKGLTHNQHILVIM